MYENREHHTRKAVAKDERHHLPESLGNAGARTHRTRSQNKNIFTSFRAGLLNTDMMPSLLLLSCLFLIPYHPVDAVVVNTSRIAHLQPSRKFFQ